MPHHQIFWRVLGRKWKIAQKIFCAALTHIKGVSKFFARIGLFFIVEELKTVKFSKNFRKTIKFLNFWKSILKIFLPAAGYFFQKVFGQGGGSPKTYFIPSYDVVWQGTIHKLRWQAWVRGQVKFQRHFFNSCSKLVEERGGGQNFQNFVTVFCEWSITVL